MPPMTASDRLEPSPASGRAVLAVLAVLPRLLAVLAGLLAVLTGLLAVLRIGLLAVFRGRLLAELLGRRVLLRRRVGRLLAGLLIGGILLRRVGRRLLPRGRLLLAGRRLLPGRRLVGRVARRLVLTMPRLRVVRSLRSAHRLSLKSLVVADLGHTLPCINSHDAASNVGDGAFRSGAELSRRRCIADLVCQVENLAAPADEVACRQRRARARDVGRIERGGQVAGGGPPMNGGDEALVGLAARGDPVPLLVGLQPGGDPARLGQRAAQLGGRNVGRLRGACRVTAGLEQHRGKHRRQLRGRQALPHAPTQAFGHQKIAFAVDPRQQPAVVGDPRVTVRVADEPALGEQLDDAVESSGQRIGRRDHLLL